MEKAYRNILVISALLSAICLLMLGASFVSTGLPGSVLAYALWEIIFTVLFSLLIGTSYYMVQRKGNAYAGILTFSILLMLFLFTMDYLVWDISPTPVPASRIIFELLVYGGIYVGIFFIVFSAIYFAVNKTFTFIGKLSGKQS